MISGDLDTIPAVAMERIVDHEVRATTAVEKRDAATSIAIDQMLMITVCGFPRPTVMPPLHGLIPFPKRRLRSR